MSAYHTPPGYPASSTPPASSSSLPQRPPPPAESSRGFKPAFQPQGPSRPGSNAAGGPPGFTGFAPRAIASSAKPYRNPNTTAPAGSRPSSTYGSGSYGANAYGSNYPQQGGYYAQNYQDGYAQQAPPQIRNPFAPPQPTVPGGGSGVSNGYGAQANADPDIEAQIAQWQSAYASRDDGKATQKPGVPSTSANPSAVSGVKDSGEAKPAATAAAAATAANTAAAATSSKPMTVQRSGGGQKWNDSSLLEWDPAHFRIFVGNLAGEVTDDSLAKAFARYPSMQKARVIRDKLTTKSKGFGFVSFSDGDDYFKAARDMQGKYIGSHPVKIQKSNTEIKPVVQRDNRFGGRKGGKGGNKESQPSQNGVLGPTGGGGISKKSSKTKGGLRILG